MGKYLDLVRQVEDSSNSADSGETDANDVNSNKRERGYELNELNELSPTCIFCRQPVERGTPGTGALAGADLHVDCYEKHLRKRTT